MSLLGVDVGTGGVKAVLFSESGAVLATGSREYRPRTTAPGTAELDAAEVWSMVKAAIAEAAAGAGRDPVRALCATSMGEAMVPVSPDRGILGPSLLANDARGAEYLEGLRRALPDERLFAVTGNTLGNIFGLTKLLWVQEHRRELWQQARWFLSWSGLVTFLLGGEPCMDYSLANRTLLFDLAERAWSPEVLAAAGVESRVLPPLVPAGAAAGVVSPAAAEELGLPRGVVLGAGTHDQCAAALGCGAVEPGSAFLGLGSYLCAVPVYTAPPAPRAMMELGLNVEHHAAPGRYVSFVYNMGGAVVRWFRDTFAAAEHRDAAARGADVYDLLFAEMPSAPSRVSVLPHWSPMGPPDFIADSSGVMTGLDLSVSRGEILKGILQGSLFALRSCLDRLPEAGLAVQSYRVAGGGARSAAWVQLCADVLERPVARPAVTEAGALGAAILGGIAAGTFRSVEDGVHAMVSPGSSFDPRADLVPRYRAAYARQSELWPALRGHLTRGARSQDPSA